MTRFTVSLAAIVLALVPATFANPISRSDKAKIDLLIYVDKSISAAAGDLKSPAPELITWGRDDITVTSTKKTLSHGPVNEDKKESRDKRDTIIGEDDRELWTGVEDCFPGAAVGRLSWSNGLLCSAALVGPRHVLTSKYCIPDPLVVGSFAPGYDQSAKFGSSGFDVAVTMSEDPETCRWKNDWLVLVLSERLGEKTGWFGVKVPEESKLDQPIFTHQGYPADLGDGERPYRHANTLIHSEGSLECDGGAALRTDTDVAEGQSGGPLWEEDEEGNFEIWGVLAGEETTSERQVATWASGESMVQMVEEALERWP